MQPPIDIVTPRLRLVAITPELLRADLPILGTLLCADVPRTWPPEHWEPHVFDLLERQFHDFPVTLCWNRYIVLRGQQPGSPPIVIGTIGGFAKPDDSAEIGYSILQSWQRRGLATESLRALLPEIFACELVQSAIAHTFPHLIASIRVLEKCGFRRIGPGEEVGTVRYRLSRSAFDHLIKTSAKE